MSDDRFQCYLCGEYKNTMWGNTCNMCRDKEEKHRETMNVLAKASRSDSLQSQCAALEAKCAWQERIIEQAKTFIFHASEFGGDKSYGLWLDAVEKGPSDE